MDRLDPKKFERQEFPLSLLLEDDALTKCSVCGCDSTLTCTECGNKSFCNECMSRWHMHPSRKAHKSQPVSQLLHKLRGAKQKLELPLHRNGFGDSNIAHSISQHEDNKLLPLENISSQNGVPVTVWKWSCEYCTYINTSQTSSSCKKCSVCLEVSVSPCIFEEPYLDIKEADETGGWKKEEICKEAEEDSDSQMETAPTSLDSNADNAPVVCDKVAGQDSACALNHVEFRSSFVDEYDEIVREKKEAKARFEAELLSPSSSSSLSSSTTTTSPSFAAQQMDREKSKTSKYQEFLSGAENSYKKRTKQETRLVERMIEDGHSTVKLLREAELNGFLGDEFEYVLQMNEFLIPITEIKTELETKINTIRQLLDAEDLTCSYWFNSEFIRLTLVKCDGNVEQAAQLCSKEWREQIDDLWLLCVNDDASTDVSQIESIVNQFSGNFEAAKRHVIQKIFLSRIWQDTNNARKDFDQKTAHIDEELMRAIQNPTFDLERRLRMILVEADLPGWKRAENVLELLSQVSDMENNVCLQNIVEAVKTYGNIQDCLTLYLQIECLVCFGKYPHSQIQTLGCCQCKICRDCIKSHFEVIIHEKHIRDMVCPYCYLPEIDKVDNQRNTDLHFQFLSILLKPLLSSEDFDVLQTKWRDWNLMQEPSFRWCSFNECKSGFLADVQENKVQCPSCKNFMCKDCKKQWEDQHENLSCERFHEWKIANDPELQLLGVARHLEENGIECPRCKSRYSLSKGGCMHFTCSQCRHEFCSGCLQPFRRENTCKLFQRCATMGMHSHHPRDCLYYLRDNPINKLQQLLQDANVAFDTGANTEDDVDRQDVTCSVMIQNLTSNGAIDEPCGSSVLPSSASLCEMHYKEYLVSLINKNGIDPIPIMETDDLVCLIERTDYQVPPKDNAQSDDAYRKKITELILAQFPLERKLKINKTPATVEANQQV